MRYEKTNTKRRVGLLKRAVSLTLCAAVFTGVTAGAVDTTAGTSSSCTCTCGCAACSGTSIADIAEASLPFVVSITNISVQEAQRYFDRFDRYGHNQNELEETTSVGSGIIFEQTDDVLYIVTNYHVVEDATTLSVGFVNDEVYEAELCGTDEDNDLAVLKVSLDDLSADTRAAISVAVLGDSDALRVGEQVVAIGNALGYGQSVTTGIISALNRSISTGTDAQGSTVQSTYIQTDAAINPGNSGGALLDMNGNLIGINAAKTASTEVEGMGFAIPISKAQEILNNLMTKQTRVEVPVEEQGYLGIQCINIDSASSQQFGMPIGVYVYKIMEDGAAANSDLREKDIITKFDGQSVSNKEELVQMLTYYKSGTTVTLTVQSLTDGAYVEHEVEITLGSRPADEANQ